MHEVIIYTPSIIQEAQGYVEKKFEEKKKLLMQKRKEFKE